MKYKNLKAIENNCIKNLEVRQKKIKNVKNIYVFPNMGDGGLAVGAAVLCANQKRKIIKFKSDNMYLGPEDLKKIPVKSQKKYQIKKINIPKNELYDYVGKLLNNNKVIALVNGRMEFGPRALCNRSIICSPKNKQINRELNKKLKRTEFMPFAPVVEKKSYSKYFYSSEKKHINVYNMTITVKCKNLTKKVAPAIVHIDGTARPQIIDNKSNNNMFQIMKSYKKYSNNPILINTSLNLHEEPIVSSTNDAIRAFKSSRLDYLLINNCLYTHAN